MPICKDVYQTVKGIDVHFFTTKMTVFVIFRLNRSLKMRMYYLNKSNEAIKKNRQSSHTHILVCTPRIPRDKCMEQFEDYCFGRLWKAQIVNVE